MAQPRIQIVEDESIIRMDLKSRLRGLGYTVAGEAASGVKAIEVARETSPDLVMMDIHLKGEMDGIQAATAIWNELHIPVIYVTAHADEATLQRAKLAEPFGYLLKPFEARELHTAIEVAIYKHTMERALHAEKERLRVTLGSIADAVITTDQHGVVDFMNVASETLTGWSRDEAVGKAIEDVFALVDQTRHLPVDNPARRCLREGQSVFAEKASIMTRRDGQETVVQHSAAPIRDAHQRIVGAVLVCQDITTLHEMNSRMAYQATHDSLTGLYNRRQFEVSLDEALERAKALDDSGALCYLDLDYFKLVNDTSGHAAGDQLLKEISEHLSECLRDDDILARLGGDEFGVILSHCHLDDAHDIATRLLDRISAEQFMWEDNAFQISASAGLVPITGEAKDSVELLSMVDCACYMAKENGRSRVHAYRSNDADFAMQHGQMRWVQRITTALQKGQLGLYCQPTQRLKTATGIAQYSELLLRLFGDDGQVVPASRFVKTAERYRQVVALDRWVVKTAFESLAATEPDDDTIYGINLSGLSLSENGFLDYVLDQLVKHHVEPGRVCFEITESAAVTSFPRALGFVSAVRAAGCLLALDDFGSGMSSFGYLKNLEIDFLKIDGSFVRTMARDPFCYSLVQAINDIGHTMGVRTIAEFAESQEIIDMLQDIGVDYAQGYAVARPGPSGLFARVPNVVGLDAV